jgi:uncharacterized protein (UPF0332 family)/predicted nucleotidyltransferase
LQKTIKETAARLFVDELLRQAREEVAQVVLFGSIATGQPHPESDVDLLILALGDVCRLRDIAAGVAFEIGLETGESVEPVVLPLWRRFQPSGLFVHEALRRGKDLYSMAEEDLYEAEFSGRIDLAKSYLGVAEYVFANGDYRQAADLAYNAVELVAKTLLIGKVENLPTSHSGVVNLFGQHLVLPGIVSRDLGREMRAGLEIRNRARYDHTAEVGEEDAQRLLNLTRELLQEAG